MFGGKGTGRFQRRLEDITGNAPNKVPTPTLKEGGKIADTVPISVPKNWSKADIEDAILDYERSIAARKAEQAKFDKLG